ncbi:MAG: IclR family transcriptional regulator [Oscillospiraceae bacterium]|jgi:DNA-binding IclR family transcriptional regulator
MPNQNKKPSMTNQSTEKAMAIIELLAKAHSPMRLRDISNALNLNVSTTLRFLASLQNCHYVEQERDSQRYYLTYKICQVASRVSRHMELQTITHPYLIALSDKFQESLCVSVERDMTMVYIDVATGPNRTLMSMQSIGNTSPMHCTGNGKLLLLNYTPEQLDELIRKKGLTRFTANTITTRQELLAELEQIRARGYAYDNEESEEGVRCLACPIRDYTGDIVAGMSVTGPASRMTDEKINQILDEMMKTTNRISEALGYDSNLNN